MVVEDKHVWPTGQCWKWEGRIVQCGTAGVMRHVGRCVLTARGRTCCCLYDSDGTRQPCNLAVGDSMLTRSTFSPVRQEKAAVGRFVAQRWVMTPRDSRRNSTGEHCRAVGDGRTQQRESTPVCQNPVRGPPAHLRRYDRFCPLRPPTTPAAR